MTWGRRPMGVRRLLTLVRQLPRDSALSRNINGEWGDVEHLLAFIGDHMYRTAELVQGAHYSAGHGSKQSYSPRPFRIPRPGGPSEVEAEKAPKMSSAAQIRQFFGAAIRYVPESANAN